MDELGYMEWRNTNSYRRYPFGDNQRLTSATGVQLSNDVFIDAMFFPINPQGVLRLKSIQVSQNKLIIWDSLGEICTSIIDRSSDIQNFYDTRGRHIGIMVTGPGFANMTTDMEFDAGVSELSSGCVNPQSYACLRSFVLPDGTTAAADVVFEGESGVTIITEYIDGVPVLRFDAVGVAAAPDCTHLGDPVKCIRTSQTGSGGALMIGQVENIIALDTAFTLQELCVLKKHMPDTSGKLPTNEDACETPQPPVPCTPPVPPVPASTQCPAISYQDYFIRPIGDTIGIQTVIVPPSVQDQLPSSNANALPARNKGGLKLSIKGA